MVTTNIDTVLGIYEAFGRGDVPHILEQMSDDVLWDDGIRDTGLSYLRPGRGKDHVRSFFAAVSSTIEFTVFDVGTPCAGGDTVMVPLREAGRNLVTGAPLDEDVFVHIWTFADDGKVSALRHVGDFAIHEAAARAQASAPARASN